MIYVIDDDDSVRASLVRLMRAAGLTAGGFASAEDFLRDAGSADDCECVVIDVHLPGMNGLELQRELQNRASTASVVMMTAFDDADVRRDALTAGALAMLIKPFSDSVLLQVLAEATRRRQSKVNSP